jgi:hypothetical protein
MRTRLLASAGAIAALALSTSAAFADSSLTPGFVDDVKADGGPPAFVADLGTEGGPPAWVDTANGGSTADEDGADLDTTDQGLSGGEASMPDQANVPEWVADVKTDGGPPAWVGDVKTDGGPPAFVDTQRSSSAQPAHH